MILFFFFFPMVLQSRVTNVLPFSLSPSLLVIFYSHLSLCVSLFLSLTYFVFVCFCFYYSLIFPLFFSVLFFSPLSSSSFPFSSHGLLRAPLYIFLPHKFRGCMQRHSTGNGLCRVLLCAAVSK